MITLHTSAHRALTGGIPFAIALAGLAVSSVAVAARQVGPSSDAARTPTAQAPTTTEPSSDLEMWSSNRYRITPGDMIQLTFVYVPEFDQTVSVQPDGYVSLRAARDVFAQGLTVEQFRRELMDAYAPVLREPVISVSLKEFEKPYFIAAGEIARPGKFELRGATTVTQALAMAGGLNKSGKSSQVVLFRRFSNDHLEVKTFDVKKMFRSRDLSEDALLRPGDTLYVPATMLSNLSAFIPQPSLGLFLDPLRLGR
jgi:polysaccharide export outer membrane protein